MQVSDDSMQPNSTTSDIITAGNKQQPYSPQIIIPSVSFLERQNVTFDIHNELLADPPEFPSRCQMTSRLSGVTRQPGRSLNNPSTEVT